MSSQVCSSIDTLSMSYLDEELAPEEKRELELHLLDCTSCRDHVSEERQEVNELRKRLAMPPMPDLVRAKVTRLIDREEAQISRDQLKERVRRWILPGTSIAAAAAALVVFVFLGAAGPDKALPFAQVVGRPQQTPLTVRGERDAQTWLQQQIAGSEAPRFEGIDLLGGNLATYAGRTVARLVYEVSTTSPQSFQLEAFLFRPQPDELTAGEEVQYRGLVLHVATINGQPAVTYVDENGLGYIFSSRDLSARTLLELVCSSNLIDRARRVR